MAPTNITTDNTVFVILSFEGPDQYSLAGGLGVRISNIAAALAAAGFTTHLIFIGAPKRKKEEITKGGKLILRRWCQWISEYYPDGVYQGENEKLNDFNVSIPWYVTRHIVQPAVAGDKLVVIMGEEWHTAESMCRISDLLHHRGLRDRVVMFWNANNVFGFERINWGRLAYTTTITTVSRYMKHIMWKMGLNPLVIPNGIPKSLLDSIDAKAVTGLKRRFKTDLLLTKVARWDSDKRWHMAVEATAQLKARRMRTVLLARGGIESYGREVMHNASSLGLTVKETMTKGDTLEDYFQAIGDNDGADILNIRFHCPQDLLRIIYRASDAVLANSGHEPFGIVGLETMAAGGIVFTGGTGEDYAIPFHNSIVLETSDPHEILDYVVYLDEHPGEDKRIRMAARRTARRFTWEEVIKNLILKLEYQARNQGIMAVMKGATSSTAKPAEYPESAPGQEPEVMPVRSP
jgi:glycosyltransferase involved in cell wall biosynthesis